MIINHILNKNKSININKNNLNKIENKLIILIIDVYKNLTIINILINKINTLILNINIEIFNININIH